MKNELLIGIGILLILSTLTSAQIFLGTIDGFAKNSTGSPIVNASVNVTLSGCTGGGCSGVTTTDSAGYYVIANLDSRENQTATITINKSNLYGTTIITFNSLLSASGNTTVLSVPFPPTIVAINNTHNNTFILFNWTSGTDPNNISTVDQFILDGTTANVSAPQNRSFISFSFHTWSVRTCNAIGCSPDSTDTFNVTNNLPAAPNLTDVSNSNANNITFRWNSSGADPDGDSTYFVFELDGVATSNATSPLNMTVSGGAHTWKVQECDPFDCSDYSIDTFSITNNAPSAPTLVAISNTQSTTATFTWTSGVDANNDTTFDEFQFGTEAVVTPATSGVIHSISGTQLVTWRVRTCDNLGACSSYTTSNFVKYSCPTAEENVTEGGGGGGGGFGGFRIGPGICIERWQCSGWGPCPKGRQTRSCTDLTGCPYPYYKPIEEKVCTLDHCKNNMRDSGEEGVDCGGECRPCFIEPLLEAPGIISATLRLVVRVHWLIIFISLLIIAAIGLVFYRKRKQ